jgi:hypothetical protein
MPVGTRNTSPEQMAANLAAYKAKVAAKIEARKAKATSAVEVDELSSLLSRVSMSSSVDDLDDLLKGLSMGGRRRTRRNKSKGKKRGGENPCQDLEEQVKELEEAVARRDRQLGRRGGTRKHSRKTRKTRRGGVQPPAAVNNLTYEDYVEEARRLNEEYEALMNDPNSTAEEIAMKRRQSIKADNKVRFLKRGQEMR